MRALIPFVFALAVSPAGATAPDLAAQRATFAELHARIGAGDDIDFDAARNRLRGYVLAPYIDYFYLQSRLRDATPGQIAAFVRDNRQLPVTEGLREAYLRQVGRRGDWRAFTQLYRPTGDAELQCFHLSARHAQLGVDADWLADARRLWLVGRSQPSACDPVFTELYARDAISADHVWQRVTLLLKAGDERLARHFSARLDPERRSWFQHWLAAHRRPQAVLDAPPFPLGGPYAGEVIAHAVRRLGRADPEAALAALARYRDRPPLTASQHAELAREVALQAAYSQDPRALGWLDALPPAAVTDHVRTWTARMALRNQDWPRLLLAIEALPDAERTDTQWRYWRAHALWALGERATARDAFARLAQERNYYGFLAADRLGVPYNLNHVPTSVSDQDLAATAEEPGIRRAHELFQLGLMPEARREWQNALARLNTVQQQHAAVLALQWGWYDRAVATANHAGLDDDLDLRFPLPYRERVELYSRQNGLDPHITYAIVRKESAFRPDAVSAVGALGLMQVMPTTGRQVAKRLQTELPKPDGLLDIDTNLQLGGAYLRAMLDTYNDNLVLAAAAYNAGPHRVQDWLQRNAGLPPALWIEAISFYETREYVKSILAFAAVFDWRLDESGGRLSRYLRPFGPEVSCAEPQDGESGGCQSPMM